MKTNYKTIQVELQDNVAVFTMNNPPVNQLSAPFRVDLTEAFGGDQPDPGALALGDGIDDDGRAVHEGREVAGRDVVGRDDIHHAFLELRRGSVALAGDDLTLRGHEHQVRECPSDIRCYSEHIGILSLWIYDLL